MDPDFKKDYKLYGVFQIQQRAHEDRFSCFCFCTSKLSFRCYSIFDGHGGSMSMDKNHVADYCVEHIHKRLAKGLSEHYSDEDSINIKTIINTLVYFDIEMYNNKLLHGTTCTMILIDVIKKKIYQVNIGDSRSIIFIDNNIISESKDHNPKDETEKNRIINSGSFVYDDRVEGNLAVSRGFGDYKYKKITQTNKDGIISFFDPVNGAVSAIADIKVIDILDNMYIILTSDAPFEHPDINSQSLVNMFNKYYSNHNLKDTALLMATNISANSSDDTTIIVVKV